MPDDERRQLLDILQSGSLPIPRDLRDSMLAEFSRVTPAIPAPNDGASNPTASTAARRPLLFFTRRVPPAPGRAHPRMTM